jgi:hypothetical protein
VLVGAVVVGVEVGVFPVVADPSVKMPALLAGAGGDEATGAVVVEEEREEEARAVALDVVPVLLAPMHKYL